MKKPRIFINMHYLEIGGAERALIGLLCALDSDRVDVDLFLNQHTGEFMRYVPSGVHLLPEIGAYSAIERPIRQILREGHFAIAAARMVAKVRNAWHRLRHRSELPDASIFQHVAQCVAPWLPSLKHLGRYDLAISFLTPHNIVAEKVDAARRIAWIHTDYTRIGIDVAAELPVWSQFDYIASISPDCTKAFLQLFPSLESRIIEIHNILSPALVRSQAQEFEPKEYAGVEGTIICSVGRICEAKNYDNVPRVAQMLKARGMKFHWFIIGPGSQDEVRRIMSETGTDDVISLLGTRANPYPYIAGCDLYLQPSRYEGNSVTVREAQILCRPVIITRYGTSADQVQHGVDGIICEMDNSSIAEAIYRVANDDALRKRITAHLAQADFGNETSAQIVQSLATAQTAN